MNLRSVCTHLVLISFLPCNQAYHLALVLSASQPHKFGIHYPLGNLSLTSFFRTQAEDVLFPGIPLTTSYSPTSAP